MKKTLSTMLAALLLISCLSIPAFAAEGLDNFKTGRKYKSNIFTDVSGSDWFYKNVAAMYEYGLMSGTGEGFFGPWDELTMAQAVALAARIHSIYYTGKDNFKQGSVWYDVYVDYAVSNGIISRRSDMEKSITRGQFADILSRALPASALAPRNTVEDNSIPDVKSSGKYASGIYALYRAGVASGADGSGSFQPDSSITRAEAAAMINRMIDPSQRKSITLYTIQDDKFFQDAAFLGNSLVDGIRLYTKLKTASYFCASSVTVFSAMNTKDSQLSDGTKASLVDALTENQYGKIYIELGINEIGFDQEYFIDLYTQLIDKIAEAETGADIYILSITPVTREKADSSNIFTMTRIRSYNTALKKLAKDKGCTYLDLCSYLQDKDGFMPDGEASDGVHPYPQYYEKWESFLRTNYKR